MKLQTYGLVGIATMTALSICYLLTGGRLSPGWGGYAVFYFTIGTVAFVFLGGLYENMMEDGRRLKREEDAFLKSLSDPVFDDGPCGEGRDCDE